MKTKLKLILATILLASGLVGATESVTMPNATSTASGGTGVWLITVPAYALGDEVTVEVTDTMNPLQQPLQTTKTPAVSDGNGGFHAVVAVNLASAGVYKFYSISRADVEPGDTETDPTTVFHRRKVTVTVTSS